MHLIEPKSEDYNGGFNVEDLDAKAVLREKEHKNGVKACNKAAPVSKKSSFPPIKSITLENCTRCQNPSDQVIWDAICQDCKSEITNRPVLLQIFEILGQTYNHHGIISWLLQPNSNLNGRTPSKAIDEGDIRDVLKTIKD